MDHPHAYARRVLINLAFDGATRRTRRHEELAGNGSSAVPISPTSPRPGACTSWASEPS
jgi:hypothetical protein